MIWGVEVAIVVEVMAVGDFVPQSNSISADSDVISNSID